LNIDNFDHKEVLELQRAKKYITTNKLNYKKIEEAATKSNLLY